MANSRQATKRAEQNRERAAHNASQRSRLRTAIKKLRKSIETDSQNQSIPEKMVQKTLSIIDKSVTKGLTHPNKAARLKSRLSRGLRKNSQTKLAESSIK